MLGSDAGFRPYELRTSVIRITSYERKNMQGCLVNPYFGGEVYFENLTQLLFLIEDMLDDIKYPQRGMEKRHLTMDESGAHALERKTPPPNVSVLAGFKVSILFRQNASWQGSIIWMEQNMQSQFRSVLELVDLIDSVLVGI